jgi:hypothetical protein
LAKENKRTRNTEYKKHRRATDSAFVEREQAASRRHSKKRHQISKLTKEFAKGRVTEFYQFLRGKGINEGITRAAMSWLHGVQAVQGEGVQAPALQAPVTSAPAIALPASDRPGTRQVMQSYWGDMQGIPTAQEMERRRMPAGAADLLRSLTDA